MKSGLDKVIFKAFLPYADVIEDVSDERAMGDGIWVYPTEPTSAAEGICAPSTLHEGTVRELLPYVKEVAREIRSRRVSALLREFATYEEAARFRDSVNRQNTAAEVPDVYWRATTPREVR